ncbi:hypothetical protein GCM10020358_39970 [Amorphoplanes nipponensis]|uniref:hypothetical protein n=1 Tax=Actinoplanes nipponensis TaxID=135950 RepID=UPI0031F0248A
MTAGRLGLRADAIGNLDLTLLDRDFAGLLLIRRGGRHVLLTVRGEGVAAGRVRRPLDGQHGTGRRPQSA